MKTIRKGNDIVVRWRIFRYGQKYDIALYRESISLVLSNMGEKKEITDYSIVDVNTIVFKYRAEDQGLGIYRLLLIDKSRNSTRIIEECNAFRLVNTSDAANNGGTLESAITITLTSELTAPADGLSAYEVALQNGFIGTEEEWLQSLKGEQGPQGIQGDKGDKGDRGEQGEKGLSAYQVAIANGFVGTEAEWLQSLVPDTTDIELAEAQRQAKELERIEAENARQSAELERQNASTEAVASANAAASNANAAASSAQQKAEEANAAASSANAVVEGFNSIIVQGTGDAQDKVMSQKAVTDAMTASQAKLSELETKFTKSAEISHGEVSGRVVKNDGTSLSGSGYWSSISYDISSLKGKIKISSDWNPKEITSPGYSNVLLWSIFNGSSITSELIAQGTTASDGLTSAEIDLDSIAGYKTLWVTCETNTKQVLAINLVEKYASIDKVDTINDLLSASINSINSVVSFSESTIIPQIAYDGYFLSSRGTKTQLEGYAISSPIRLYKGDKIIIKSSDASGASVARCCSWWKYGDKTKQVLNLATKEESTFEYVANEYEEDIVVCWNKIQGIDVKILTYRANNVIKNYLDNNKTLLSISIFDDIAVCGDSFTIGSIFVNGVYQGDFLKTSWGKVLGRMIGANVSVYASGGADTNTWQTRPQCLPKLLNDTPHQLYILCLGINDYAYVTKGTIADIHEDYSLNPNTYYGNYGKIIAQIKEHAPTAKIVICKSIVPSLQNGVYAKYADDAVEEIANYFNIPFIETSDSIFLNSDLYNGTMEGGHPTAPTYGGLAVFMRDALSNLLATSIDYFKDLLIGDGGQSPIS